MFFFCFSAQVNAKHTCTLRYGGENVIKKAALHTEIYQWFLNYVVVL